MTLIKFRHVDPGSDIEELSGLLSVANGRTIPQEQIKSLMFLPTPTKAFIVAEDERKDLISYGHFVQKPEQRRTQATLYLATRPDMQRNGLAAGVYHELVKLAAERGVSEFMAETSTDPAVMALADKLGFTAEMTNPEQRLHLADFSAVDFMDSLAREDGITFSSQLEVENPAQVEELYTQITGEPAMPTADRTILALDGERCIGFTQIRLDDEQAHHGKTGVLPDYTGRGIEKVLVLMAILYAQEKDVQMLEAGDRPELYGALGYTSTSESIRFVKSL
jgi:GNAT superfamily N-acetyltransferase